MRRSAILGTAILCGWLLVSCGNGKQSNDEKDTTKTNSDSVGSGTMTPTSDAKEPRGDDRFALAAADGGMLEVELGKLAQTKAIKPEVKRLAEMMVTDHTKLNGQLKVLAEKRNIILPGSLSKESQEKYDNVAKKSGAEFDRDYTGLMVSSHQEAVDAFQKEAEEGTDANLKSWVAGEIPLLQHHLEIANYTLEVVTKK